MFRTLRLRLRCLGAAPQGSDVGGGAVSRLTIHTLFIPAGQSPEQTWEHLSRGHVTDAHEGSRGTWVNLEVEGLTTDGDRVTGGRLVRVWQEHEGIDG